MTKVDFYSVEVKYHGEWLEDFGKDTLIERALARVYNGVEPYDRTEELPDDEAKKLDGKFSVDNKYPCNKLAVVSWAEIHEDLVED